MTMRDLMRIVETSSSGLAVTFDDELNAEDKLRCAKALRHAHDLLRSKKLLGLLAGPLHFQHRNDGNGGEYIPSTDTVLVDGTGDDLEVSMKLIHELGHRLQFKTGFRGRVAILMKHLLSAPGWHPNQYAQQNHWEMFAEIFRLFVFDRLPPKQTAWMEKFVSARRPPVGGNATYSL